MTGFWKRIGNILGNGRDPAPAATRVTRRVFSRDEHPISRKHISDNALKVLHRLRQADHEAFLVGGGVRDLLLDGHPKDFDVATDATPEEVRALFRNSRIVGRRFKIAHVNFGRETIEVTTFRGSHDSIDENAPVPHAARSESGMLLRDNVYGTLEEDAIRRDFTINALYYCSSDFSVHDYVGGMADIQQRRVRVIGDPATRYREDPVRLLRAVRFAAKLDFDLEPGTAAPLKELAPLLSHVAAARMFDEVLKLFMGGHGLRTYALMQRYGLFAPLFPDTAQLLAQNEPSAEELIQQGLINTDVRIAEGKPVTPAFIYAVLLWPVVRRRQAQLAAEGVPEIPALHQAAQWALDRQQKHTAIPRRFSLPMRDIWELQFRFAHRDGRRAEQLLENRYFRAGYDFLLLREQAGEIEEELGPWWTAYQEASPEHRAAMQKTAAVPAGKRRRKRRPRTRKPQ